MYRRTENHESKRIVTKVKLKVCFTKITEIVNKCEYIEIEREVSVLFNCFVKLKYLNKNIF